MVKCKWWKNNSRVRKETSRLMKVYITNEVILFNFRHSILRTNSCTLCCRLYPWRSPCSHSHSSPWTAGTPSASPSSSSPRLAAPRRPSSSSGCWLWLSVSYTANRNRGEGYLHKIRLLKVYVELTILLHLQSTSPDIDHPGRYLQVNLLPCRKNGIQWLKIRHIRILLFISHSHLTIWQSISFASEEVPLKQRMNQ